MLDGVAEKLRDGLFLAASRTYGEQYIEPFIRKQYNLSEPGSNDFDAIDRINNIKYEIKAAKVLRKVKKIKNQSILQRIVEYFEKSMLSRKVAFNDRFIIDYDANIQNVKRDHFDYLIYVLLFEDCVEVFEISKELISGMYIPNWSDKHGRYDELGKSGQFNITKRSISIHEEHYKRDIFTYEHLKQVYEVIK